MKLNQKDLETDIITLARDGTTYAELCGLLDATATQKMQIDRTLQKLRRTNKIRWQREGKAVVWHTVPETPVACQAAV